MGDFSFVCHSLVRQMGKLILRASTVCVCRLNKGWLGEGFCLLLEEEACGLCGQVSASRDAVTP